MALLDLTADFGTVDRKILLCCYHWVGLAGSVLKIGFRNYPSDCEYYVVLAYLSCGVPQGSILGTTLFNLYTLLLAKP